jgi:DUF1009 family protein
MLALIAGNTDLPHIIIKKLYKKKIDFIILDLTSNKTYKNHTNSYSVKITQLDKALLILKKNNCNKIILAGKVNRPELSMSDFSFRSISYFKRLYKAFRKGDGNILKEIIKIFRENKITVISSMTYTPELIFKEKSINNFKINDVDKSSIKKGINIIKNLSKFDIGQSVVINNGFVLAIEGPEGTDIAIKRASYLKKKYNLKHKSILVKFPKSNQDLRVDLPTIGLKTIKNCIKANIKGIALKKNQNIFLDKNKIISIAKKNNFFITSI